jgi:DNA-binding NarL/FixJ family response regulator
MCGGIDRHLSAEPGIDLVEVAANAEAALADREDDPPDVCLVVLAGLEGIEATRHLSGRWRSSAVVVLSVDNRAAFALDALRAGARSYLTADCSARLLSHAIHISAAGGMVLASEPALNAFRQLGLVRGGRPPELQGRAPAPPLGVRLTAREMEILQLLADGCSNKEISARLHLAVVTVKKYVQSVSGKLGVSDRTQAAVYGLREGLVR